MIDARDGTGPVSFVLAFLGSRAARAIFYQVVVIAAVLGAGYYLVSNVLDNLASRNIATGFSFLAREAGFPIAEHAIEYSPASTYGRAYLVGILNTLQVSAIGIVLATILGVVIGVARLSSNWLVARLASGYVETIRNTPLVLQLFFWYALILALPGPKQALALLNGSLFISNRGIDFPLPDLEPVHGWMLALVVLGVAAVIGLGIVSRRRQMRTGMRLPVFWLGVALALGPALILFFASGMPLTFLVPELKGFNFAGGARLSPEFFALVFGLTVYTAAFIAEVVRAGILAVPRGQTEASLAVGLKRGHALRFVILPQALRLIVPPLTNQYLNLTKNSSLAVAIGYQELVSIGQTTINQTGQAIEGIAMIMAVYLTISLAISAFMNWYNKRIALKER
ncbi:MAG: amino acid ABC transporter permease [Alphaproteobacteria bacterium]